MNLTWLELICASLVAVASNSIQNFSTGPGAQMSQNGLQDTTYPFFNKPVTFVPWTANNVPFNENDDMVIHQEHPRRFDFDTPVPIEISEVNLIPFINFFSYAFVHKNPNSQNPS